MLDDDKSLAKKAVVKYVLSLGPEAELPALNKTTYCSVLPFLAQMKEPWAKVTPQNLNVYKHLAHKQFQNTVQNYFHSKAIKHDLEEARKVTDEPELAEDAESYDYEDVAGSDDDAMYHNAQAIERGEKIQKRPKKEDIQPESGPLSPRNGFPVESVLGKRPSRYVNDYIDESYDLCKIK